jgi:formylglycine-generating enzyme required for sulfatase activity
MSNKLDSAFDFYFAEPTNTLLPVQANFAMELNRPCKVGSYPPSRLGLFDMHGNVWEFFHDTRQLPDGRFQLCGGGNWDCPSNDCRMSIFCQGPRNLHSGAFGLRLARVPSGATAPEAKSPPP